MLQDVVNAIALGSVYLLFALGMALAWGTIGVLNFAHGATFMFAAFIAFVISERVALPMPAVVLIAALAGAVISCLTQLLVFQRIMNKARDLRAAELQILIAGIGVAVIPLAIAQRLTNGTPFGFGAAAEQAKVYVIGGLRLTSLTIIIIVVGLGLGIGAAWWLKSSRRGLALRSIGVDPETASLMGVNRTSLALVTMAVAGALAGLAGALLTYQLGAIAAETGDVLLIKAFAAIVLGGLGSQAGVIVGSYFLAFAETWVTINNWGTWADAISFGLIFLMLLVRPQGFFGRKEVRRT
jgi:Branched-chain amino acid ABC-type transport system, permease components